MLRSNVLARLAAIGLALAVVWPLAAEPRQAPGSKLILDLPHDYLPSRNFTGFLNEPIGTSIVLLEMPAVAYEQLASGMTPEALAARGIPHTDTRRNSVGRVTRAMALLNLTYAAGWEQGGRG